MLPKTRVLLLDDDSSIRTLLRLMLDATPDFELLDATADIAQLPQLCAASVPHIFLMGGGDKTFINETLLILQTHTPHTRVIVLLSPDTHLPELFDLPIHGSCLKAEINKALVHILRAVVGGATCFSRGAHEQQFAANIDHAIDKLAVELTASERRVLALLACGLDNDAIARELNLHNQSVRNCVSTIYSKLQTHDRAKIVARILGKVLPKPEV